MNSSTKQVKTIIMLVCFIIASLVLWASFSTASNAGKIATKIDVMPTDAAVKIDNIPSGGGTHYLAPGSHVFTASKVGFSTATITLTISKDVHYVGLLPTPVSDEAKKWAAEDDVWPKRERIAGARSETTGTEAYTNNPLLNYLPYSDITGPFSIDYASDPFDSTKTRVIISNSTPQGRLKAIEWIRSKGVDPADLTIKFDDFFNPTTPGDI